MINEENKEFIKKAKNKYKNIKYVECPAFNNEIIVFNNYGFNHLIYKGKRARPKNEILIRLSLLDIVPHIIKNIKSIYRTRNSIKRDSIARFWELRSKNNSKIICIVIRKINDNPPHFFSVFTK